MKECNFVNVNDLNQHKQTSLMISVFDDLRKKIIVPINHGEILEDLIEHKVDLFAEKDTNLGNTNTIKMINDTGNHPPIKQRLYRTPFCQVSSCRQGSMNDMLAANIIHPSR